MGVASGKVPPGDPSVREKERVRLMESRLTIKSQTWISDPDRSTGIISSTSVSGSDTTVTTQTTRVCSL